MKQYFSFNPYSHDFWPIYDAIKTFYPIGLKQQHDMGLHQDYEGHKMLGAVLVDNIHNPEHFQERFGNFRDQIERQFGLPVQGTTYGQQPAFSFDIILEKTEYPGLSKIKKLCLAVSLLGNFYTIFGADETIVIKEGDPYPSHFHAINAVTVSPHKEFEQPYLELKAAVQEHYPSHKQVPYAILSSYLEGFYDKFAITGEGMIYNALFDQKLNNNYLFQLAGNSYYGYDEWVKEGYDGSDFKSVEVVVMPLPPVQPPNHLI